MNVLGGKSFLAFLLYSLSVACSSGDGGGGVPDSSPAPVPAASTGSVTLQWDAVSAGDLAGYKVYASTSAGSLGSLLKGDIPASTTSYTAGNLQLGTTYYFVVKSYDTSGNESSASNQVSKTVQ
jgi:fibronectin type 3 domain-containing protein